MIKLIGHEFAKLFSHKVLWGVVSILLLIDLSLVYHDLTTPNEYGYRAADEANVYAFLSKYPKEEWEGLLTEQIDSLAVAVQTGQSVEVRYSGSAWGDLQLLRRVVSHEQACSSYDEYLRGVFTSADDMSNSFFWGDAGSFVSRNAEQTAQAYKSLIGLQFYSDVSNGVLQIFANRMTDIFLLLAIAVVLLQILVEERESGLVSLLKSTKNGRTSLLIAKAAVMTLVLMWLTVIFYLANSILAQQLVGLGDLTRPIQSVEGFLTSPYRVSAGEALALFFVLKYIGMLTTASILFLICVFCRSRVPACLAGAFILGMSQLIYSKISPLSWASFLRPCAPIAFLDTSSYLAQYRTVNCMGWPINFNTVSTVAALLLGGGSVALALYRFEKEPDSSAWTLPRIPLPNVRRHIGGLHTNLTRHEIYKLVVGQNGVFVLLALLLLQMFSYGPMKLVANEKEQYYMQYAAILEGELSPQKETFLREEAASFVSAQQEISEYIDLAANGEISQDSANYFIGKLTVPKEREDALEQAARQYALLQDYEMNAEDVAFLSQVSWDRLLGPDGIQADRADAGKFAVALVIFLCAIVSFERSTQVAELICTSPRGMVAVNRRKALLTIAFSFLFMILAFVPRAITVFRFLPPQLGSMSCHSVLCWSYLPSGLSVSGAWLFMWVERMMGAALAAQLTLFFARLFRQTVPTLLASLLVLLIPVFAAVLGSTGEGFLLPVMTGHLYLLNFEKHLLYILLSLAGMIGLLFLNCSSEKRISPLQN